MVLLKQTDYLFSSAYLRAIENRLLTKNDFESLILASDFTAAAKALRDKGFSDGEITPENLDLVLQNRLNSCRQEAIWSSPDENVLDIFSYRNDFHNLKAVIKALSAKKSDYERFFLKPCTINPEIFVKAVADIDFSILPDGFKSCAEEAFYAHNKSENPALAECIIDKACMDYMMNAARETKNEFLSGLIKLENTLSDIKIAVRCAFCGKERAFVEKILSDNSGIDRDGLILASVSGKVSLYLKEKGMDEAAEAINSGLGEFEKYADNKISEYIEGSSQITFGVETVIAYIYRVEAEIRTIRVILNAKNNKIPETEIRKRVRNI